MKLEMYDSLIRLLGDPFLKGLIARASASTYNPQDLARLNLQIHLNIDKKTRYVGNPHVYPDIVIWRPDYFNANTGQAVIVEVVETDNSLLYPRVNEWRILASLAGVRFNLIVPNGKKTEAIKITSSNSIKNVNVQGWNFDNVSGKVYFS